MRKDRMIFIRRGVAVLTLYALSGCSNSGPKAVESVFQKYAYSVDHQKGVDAAKLATEATLEHFEELRDYALRGGEAAARLTLYDEVSVYYLRDAFSGQSLAPLTGRDVLGILVQAGLVGIPEMSKCVLRGIEIEDSAAWAFVDDGDETTEYRIKFIREQGKWKIDNALLGKTREDVLVNRMFSHRSSRDELVGQILRSVGVKEGRSRRLSQPLLS